MTTRREFPPREWRSGKKSTVRAPKAGGTSPGWARQARRNHGRGQGRRRGHRDAAARFARALLVCAARSTRAAGVGAPGDVAPAGSRWSPRARSGSGARQRVRPSRCARAGRIPPADRQPKPSDAPQDGATADPTGRTCTGLTARIVRQISVPEPCDMSPGFASTANAALHSETTKGRCLAQVQPNGAGCEGLRTIPLRTNAGDGNGGASRMARRRARVRRLQAATPPGLACSTHPFLKKVFFTERTKARTEDTEPNPVSARWAVWAWLRALWTKLLINLRVNYPG
jgi:hypothetical protein